ncbi:aminopeptidase [Kurthia massiliensis]|uniref:aminopeptidase n=1 Tax=Kurthia massiliensis TaxID=1033739 RepID=UPI000288311A|nr:aminopeptidase [Kurthia massiliensis]
MQQMNTIIKGLLANNFQFDAQATFYVLTDDTTKTLGAAFAEGLRQNGYDTTLEVMADRSKNGEEPPKAIAEKWYDYTAVFCLTRYSLTHTVARKEANKRGVSVITMPGITEDIFFNGAMTADYSKVEQETLVRATQLSEASSVIIHTGGQYELRLPLEGRKGLPSTGVFKTPAASGNLPSGEAYIAPLEGRANGEILITGSIASLGLVDEPVLLTIRDGLLVDASGTQGKALLTILGEGAGRNVAELGIGTNYKARIIGTILEDEKAYDTIHVAFGSNHTFGGTVNAGVHIDCVTKNPEIIFR